MALSPFVFIGVGGSGGKTLRVIHEVLSNTLTSIGWQGDWPKAWQFLHIEVAAAPDGIEPGLPFTLPLSDFLPLTTPQSTYRAIDRRVSNTNRQGLDHYLAWDSWRPFPPEQTGVTISMGAGQYRAVGRVAVLNNLADVGAGVGRILAEAASADVADLRRIQELWGSENLGADNITREPTVMVIASLSGGSGSGALLDVCDVVRSYRTGEQSKVTAVVYAPEVFERKDGSLEPGIAPNTFVALNELLNASWVRSAQDLPLSREVHFSRSSINPHGDQTGPDMVYLVGRRNASVTLGNTSEIYRVMGRSLAELALNEGQQDKIGAYAIANADNRAGDVDHTIPLAPKQRDLIAHTHTNIYALGFSRLSVGREIFREYAAQRLAREAVTRLREGHRSRRLPGDRRTDEVLAEEYAEARWPSFLRESGLNEVGYDANAVIESILPPGVLEDLLTSWARGVQAKLDEGTANGQLPIDDARQQIRDEIDEALKPDGIYPSFQAQLRERAISWRRGVDGASNEYSIHQRLADLAVSEAAIAGLRVTDLLLDRLSREVTKAAAELELESRQRSQDGNDLLLALLDRKPNEPRRVETEVGGYVDQTLICTEGYGAIYQLFYAEAVGNAAAMLKDLLTKLLSPLKRGLSDASDLLKQAVEPASGRPSDFTYWPGKTDIPEHLRPGRVERTLDIIDDFPDVFLDLVVRSTGADSGDQGVSLAVEEIIRGARLASQFHAPAPYAYRGRWVPEMERLRRLDERAATAVVDVHISLSDLLERARAWAADTEKAIGRHVYQSMSDYLTDPDVGPAVIAERRARLTGEFAEMLRLSQPLIKIDTNAYQLAHGDDKPPVEVVMSPLDIPQDDRELIAELKDIAQGILHHETEIPIGRQRGGTQVMTRLTAPIHPVAVQSVMEPIYTQWASDHLGKTFWSYRRARPLLESVPMSPVAKQALAEGWVAARLLGYAYAAQNREDNRWEIRVKSGTPGTGAHWVTLPKSGPRAISKDDALGNVFELVAMTTLEVYRSKSLAPLEPFQTLVDLGAASWNEHWLRTWVHSGDGRDVAGEPILAEGSTAAERRDLLLKGLESMEDRFAVYAKLPDKKTVGELQRLPRAEIARLGIAAVEAIRAKVDNDDEFESQEGAA